MKKLILRYLVFTTVPILFWNISVSAQVELKLPAGLGISNQLEYAYDTDKDIQILENWLNVDYRTGIFSAGIRMDVFQPNDPNPAVNRGKNKYADIAFKYVQADIGNKREGIKIRIGNYYALFGRGMVLKSYEDRNLRVDNNLLGVKVSADFYGFSLQALTGMPESYNAERKDIIHALDIEYRGIKKIKIGVSVATNIPEVDGIANTTLAALRSSASISNFDLYAEYGIKKNSDVEEQIFNQSEDIIGRAFYGNINFYYGPFALTGEYKYYDNYTFMSNDGTVIYNTPPAVRNDYQYILLNRHPSALDQNNEKGFQIAAIFNLSDETHFSANYSSTKTLDPDSYYQRILSSSVSPRTQFEEFFIQGHHSWMENFKTVAGFGYSEELSSSTKNLTPVLENRFYLDEVNTIKFIIEHQLTTNNFTDEKKYSDVLILEYLHSPEFSIALVSEMGTSEPVSGKIVRKFWNFVRVGYQLGGHTDLSLLIGSRQAGNICIGGVCRYEREFHGAELKITTRLY
ncbi:DUF6029 family protein [Bacteroidota bacterium]